MIHCLENKSGSLEDSGSDRLNLSVMICLDEWLSNFKDIRGSLRGTELGLPQNLASFF